MPRKCCVARALTVVGAIALCVVPPAVRAAPKPLPALTPEEEQLRAMLEPLRGGITAGPELAPLHAWLDAREAAGKGRAAERELRRLLKRITEEHYKDLLRAAEWVRLLQIQRSELYRDVSEESISLPRAIEKTHKLAPVPLEDELLPARAGLPDAFLAGDVRALPHPAVAGEGPPDLALETENAETTDLDAPALLNRLTLDLTALGHLLHECDNDYESEKARYRTALDALAKVLRERRAAKRVASAS